MESKLEPNLTGIPETMLWTLHNRAQEAKRSDSYLHDPDCVRIYDSISYDFDKNFGRPDDSHAMRSKLFDEALLEWMKINPKGPVVELASGLETQFQRCDNSQVQWFCVDMPESIEIRKRFLPESSRCKYVPKSALDLSWMDEVPNTDVVFISAQGLFMYFEEKDVRDLLIAIYKRFPRADVMFDAIPKWFSEKTMKGYRKTKNYVAPKMPWGIGGKEIPSTIRSWIGDGVQVKTASYGFKRGFKGKVLLPIFSKVTLLYNIPPSIVRISPRPDSMVEIGFMKCCSNSPKAR